MPAPLAETQIDNLVKLYRAGLPSTKIAAKFGISCSAVCFHLKRHGVVARGNVAQINSEELARLYQGGARTQELLARYKITHKTFKRVLGVYGVPLRRRRTADPEAVAAMFAKGIGASKLVKIFRVGRTELEKILATKGLKPRGRSEQQKARMDNTSPAEIKRLTAAAHKATRGRSPTFEEKCKTAATFEKRGNRRSSRFEGELLSLLSERGLSPVPQKAIGPYNCDFALPGVAVEVLGGQWHWYGEHAARLEERTRYILNAGWHLLMIHVNPLSPLTGAVADYVVTYAKRASRNPSAAREYRVIWRAGEFSVAGSADDDKISIDPPFRGRRNSATGRYETVTGDTTPMQAARPG